MPRPWEVIALLRDVVAFANANRLRIARSDIERMASLVAKADKAKVLSMVAPQMPDADTLRRRMAISLARVELDDAEQS